MIRKYNKKLNSKTGIAAINWRVVYLISIAAACAFNVESVNAQTYSPNGCDNYAPTTGQTVLCNNTIPATPPSPAVGVQTQQNNTGNNNVTVNIDSTANRVVSGSTVGLGSASTVNNAGVLSTTGLTYAYGISFGANGRSRAGGNTVVNSGSITTNSSGSDAIHVDSTLAGSAPDIIRNSGSLNTSGSNANGVWTSSTRSSVTISNSGSVVTSGSGSDAIYAKNTGNIISFENTAAGKVSAYGSGSNAVTILGAATINNAGMICAGAVVSGICQAPASGASAIALSNTYNNTRTSIINAVGATISSPASTAIQSSSPGVDISNYGTIYSPTTAVSFANVSTNISNSLTLYAGSATTGAIAFNSGSNSEALNFSGFINSNFNNTITGLNTINAINGAQVTMSSSSGYSLVNGAVSVDSGSQLTISGVIRDQIGPAAVSSLAKSGSGALTLSGLNTYTGVTAVNAGALTISGGASLVSATSVASGATLNNNGSMTGSVSNACGGTVNNAGAINNNVINAGSLSNSGSISGALTNNNPCGVVTNTGTLSRPVTNGAMLNNNTGGVISGEITNNGSGTITNSATIQSDVENYGVFTNASGAAISGEFLNGKTGDLVNRGSIDGVMTNNGAAINYGTLNNTLTNNGQFDNRGLIRDDVANSGTFSNAGTLDHALTNDGLATNGAGGVVSGVINNNSGGQFDNYGRMNAGVNNNGLLNLSGSQHLTGPITNNGTTNLNVSQTLDGANFVNNGVLASLNSASNLELTGAGAYSQASGANFISRIDGLSAGSYSQVISARPVSIADGAVITAALNPALNLNPGDTVQNVIKGAGTTSGQGAINVNTISDRYKLDYRYDAQNNVDLYLPGNSGGNLQKYGERGTYYGALTRQTLWSLSMVNGPTTNALHQRYAVLNAVMSYDCNSFDKHNFCISAQARATGFGSQATGAGVFNIAYRPTSQTRVGVYLDYQATGGAPSVDGLAANSALTGGAVQYGYNNPTFGGYLGYSQSGYSGNPLNTGVQGFVSGGYNPGKISITRAMIVDPNLPFVDAQPGSGSASMTAYFVRGMVGYGVRIAENLTLMPYVGLRYTDVTRGGYMENFNLLVTQPLIYNSYYERLVTGFGGGMLNGKLNEKVGMMLGIGAETDFSRSANSFSGYSPIQLQADNLPFGFKHDGNWNGLRPTGMIGTYYEVAPNQRVMINGYAGQQAWSSRGYLTGLAGYQLAF